MASSSEQRPSLWKRLSVPLRIVVSGGLLAVLLYQSDPARIWELLRTINVPLFVLALALQLFGVVLSAIKWGMLLRYQGHRLPMRWLVGSYLVGQFVGTFLPTVVGGDALRIAQLGRRIESYAEASASIFVERVTGFLALCAIAGIAVASGAASGAESPLPGLPLLVGGCAVAVLAALLLARWAPAIYHVFERWVPTFAHRPIEKIVNALAAYVPSGGRLIVIVLMSFAFQAVWITLHIACGIALGIDAPVWIYAAMVPLTDIVGLVPIFLNNIGARELIFGFYLGQVGVPQSTAIALAFAIFSVRLIISALGGLVMLGQSVQSTTNSAESA